MKRTQLILALQFAIALGSLGSLFAAEASVQELRNHLPVGASLLYVAAPGQGVRKGEVVALLDPAPMIAEVQRIEALLNRAQEEAKSVQDQLGGLNGSGAGQTQIKETEEALARYNQHDAPINELTLKQAVIDSCAAYDQQQIRFNARDKLLAEGFIQKNEYDMEGSKLESTRVAADLAKARLQRFLEAEKPRQIEELTRKCEEAKQSAKRAEAQLASSKDQLTIRLGELEKRIAALRANLAANKDQLAGIVLSAPANAVFQLRPEENGPPLKQGSLVGPGELIGNCAPASH